MSGHQAQSKKKTRAVPVKWLFSLKDSNTYKACLVVVGGQEGVNYSTTETCSPTPSFAIVWWLLEYAFIYKWSIIHLYV